MDREYKNNNKKIQQVEKKDTEGDGELSYHMLNSKDINFSTIKHLRLEV